MGRAIVNKLLHAPTQRLREAGHGPPVDAGALADSVRRLFGLQEPDSPGVAKDAAPGGAAPAGEAPVDPLERA